MFVVKVLTRSPIVDAGVDGVKVILADSKQAARGILVYYYEKFSTLFDGPNTKRNELNSDSYYLEDESISSIGKIVETEICTSVNDVMKD